MQFEQRFNRFRDGYGALLAKAVDQRGRFIGAFLAATLTSMIIILPWLGRDFFPGIKSGEIDMHFRAPIGTRLEEAGKIAALVGIRAARPVAGPRQQRHRQLRPAGERLEPSTR